MGWFVPARGARARAWRLLARALPRVGPLPLLRCPRLCCAAAFVGSGRKHVAPAGSRARAFRWAAVPRASPRLGRQRQAHLVVQRLVDKRFADALCGADAVERGPIGSTGDEQDRECQGASSGRVVSVRRATSAPPACDRPATALEQRERSTAAAGLQHGVAELTQAGSGDLAHGLVVIDQDQTAAGLGGRTGTRRASLGPPRGELSHRPQALLRRPQGSFDALRSWRTVARARCTPPRRSDKFCVL